MTSLTELKNARLINPACYNDCEEMPAVRERIFLIGVSIVLLALVTVPYLIANSAAGNDHIFGGLLFNPQDGYSYLAKMKIGWQGEWLFQLPYTAEYGKGAYLYLFYILLGHLARWLELPQILIFHLARLLAIVILLRALYRFFETYLVEKRVVYLAFVLSVLASGAGWLLLPFGVITSDFWVAELYPFLSCYANPHFPLSLALLLVLLLQGNGTKSTSSLIHVGSLWIILASVILAMLSPFSLVIALVIWVGLAIWEALQGCQRLKLGAILARIGLIGVGGAPVLIYQLYAIRSDPILSGWNAQNITPAPPAWDILISLAPLILLVPFSVRTIISKNHSARLLVVWVAAGLLLLYIPWSLQRRFLVGLFIPVAALAAMVVGWKFADIRRFWLAGSILLLLAIPTNLLLLQAAKYGIQTRDSHLFLTNDEAAALAWIENNTPENAVVLAAPSTGLFIPAYTGRRVIYGHPFETVDAEVKRELVERYFEGEDQSSALDLHPRVDFVFYGPRERAFGGNIARTESSIMYRNESVLIYRIE